MRTAVPESPSETPVRPAPEQPTRLLELPTRKLAAPAPEARAERFYNDQVLGHLNEQMIDFVGRMEMLFVSTYDNKGECDASLRAGPAGFIQALDAEHIAYPEYRGNGVMASLGNISENPHVGILMIDFVEDADLRLEHPSLPTDFDKGRTPERWVVEIKEAYIHCRKHIPQMMPITRDRSWGTDDMKRKGGDYFSAKELPKPWQPTQVGPRD